MASIERTAYPRLKRQVSARELRDAYALSPEEADWARQATRSDEHLLTLTVLLKASAREPERTSRLPRTRSTGAPRGADPLPRTGPRSPRRDQGRPARRCRRT